MPAVRTRAGLLSKVLRGEEGANAVEMAVSCSILFAMLFGISQLALALYYYQFTSDAARQATRWAIVRGSTCSTNTPSQTSCGASGTDISNYVQGMGFTGVNSSSIVVTPQWCVASTSTPTTWSSCSTSNTHNQPGNVVQVTVSYPIAFTVPGIHKRMSFNVSSTSQMVISQ